MEMQVQAIEARVGQVERIVQEINDRMAVSLSKLETDRAEYLSSTRTACLRHEEEI